MLGDYKPKRIPTAENVTELLTEMAHVELIQKPRYIANCLAQFLKKLKKSPSGTKDNLKDFYRSKSPTVRPTINSLAAVQDDADRVRVYGFLTKILKN